MTAKMVAFSVSARNPVGQTWRNEPAVEDRGIRTLAAEGYGPVLSLCRRKFDHHMLAEQPGTGPE